MNEINTNYSTCIMTWLTFDPDIGSCHYGKHQKKHDEDECLKIIGSHSLHSKQYGPQQLTLSGRGDEQSIILLCMKIQTKMLNFNICGYNF